MKNAGGAQGHGYSALPLSGFRLLTLAGCASVPNPGKRQKSTKGYCRLLLPPFKEPVVVAVYEFLDKTGQRKLAASQVTTSFSRRLGRRARHISFAR